MKRAVAVCGAVAMMFVAVSVSAMGKPDFSGKWTIDAEKTAALFCIICNRFRGLYEEARERAPQLAQPVPPPPPEESV